MESRGGSGPGAPPAGDVTRAESSAAASPPAASIAAFAAVNSAIAAMRRSLSLWFMPLAAESRDSSAARRAAVMRRRPRTRGRSVFDSSERASWTSSLSLRSGTPSAASDARNAAFDLLLEAA